MAFVRDAEIAADVAYPGYREQLVVPISLKVVSPLVALFDLVWIVALGIAMGFLYDVVSHRGDGEATNYLGSAVAVALLYSVLAHAVHLYRASNLLRLRWQIGQSTLIWCAVFVLLASLVFVLKIGAEFSRGEMILFFTCGLFATIAARVVVVWACGVVISSRALKRNQVVLIGAVEELAANGALPALESYGYAVTNTFSLPMDQDRFISEKTLKARMREVVHYVRETRVDEIIVALPWNRPDVISLVENDLRVLPVPIKLVPDTMTRRMLERPLFEMGPTKAVELQRAPLSAVQRNIKRGMDQLLAALGLIVLMPFFAIIGSAVCLESRGPALFRQMRVGFNGRPFRIYKFRTMSTLDDGAVVVQATRDDRRITRLGGVLRKLSIDEVPQLINVLRGEMSLVGPRPHALAHDNKYDQLIATYAIRHKMKPGITGWAQVNGFRGETPEIGMMKQRIDSDLWYIEYWSLWLDIRILVLTVARLLKSENAY